jgi:hypothetical protein
MVIALVERGGNVRSFHPGKANGETVSAIVRENIVRESRLHTDESKLYSNVGKKFSAHETTVHSRGEYVRGDVHTNSVEGFFSILKRGICAGDASGAEPSYALICAIRRSVSECL